MHAKTTASAIAALALVAGAASAQVYTQELGTGALDDGVQVETFGPGAAPFFANAQGNDDEFQEYYVMRFDLSGYNLGEVASVELDMRHEEAFFAASGLVSLSYSFDDITALNSLIVNPSDVGGNDQLDSVEVATFEYIDTPGVDDQMTIDTYVLSDLDGLFADVEAGGVITLILEAAEPGTAALYSGIGNLEGAPVLRVTAVPTPGAAAIFGFASLTAARRRR
ncbi:MAG: hypothetical protein AAGI53_10585 [Planctomycetota bacterium]